MCDHSQVTVSAFANEGPASSLRILLVDDNVDVAESLAILLSLYGHQVLTCTHPFDAIDAAPDFAPDVCILDIGLPVMTGHELAQRLMAGGLTGAKYIAVTGYGSHEVREASRDAGFLLHFTKPVDPEVLVERLALIGVNRIH